MQTGRQVSIFRNGKNQAIRIPKEFELDAKEAIIHKKGDKLIIEPVKKKSLLKLLSSWEGDIAEFPHVEDSPHAEEDIF